MWLQSTFSALLQSPAIYFFFILFLNLRFILKHFLTSHNSKAIYFSSFLFISLLNLFQLSNVTTNFVWNTQSLLLFQNSIHLQISQFLFVFQFLVISTSFCSIYNSFYSFHHFYILIAAQTTFNLYICLFFSTFEVRFHNFFH